MVRDIKVKKKQNKRILELCTAALPLHPSQPVASLPFWEQAGASELKCYLNVSSIKCWIIKFFIELLIKMFQILLWHIILLLIFERRANSKMLFLSM